MLISLVIAQMQAACVYVPRTAVQGLRMLRTPYMLVYILPAPCHLCSLAPCAMQSQHCCHALLAAYICVVRIAR